MATLKELLTQYCPNGVEYKPLGEITSDINIGINPRKFFKLNPPDAIGFYVTVRELNGLKGVKQYDKTDKINANALSIIKNRANIELGDILFSNTGTVGKMALVIDNPSNYGVNEGIYVIKPDKTLVLSRYLYFYLQSWNCVSDVTSRLSGSTLKHITQKEMKKLNIPVPPLPVQEKIVEILDAFTSLEAELEAELEMRKKQYNFYRDSLLDFDRFSVDCVEDTKEAIRDGSITLLDVEKYLWKLVEEYAPNGVEYKPLKTIGNVRMCKRILKDQTSNAGDVPFYKIGTFGKTPDAYISRKLFEDYKKRFNFPKKGNILISASGTIGKTVIYDGEPAYFQDSNIIWIENDETILLDKYLYYYYETFPWKVETGSTISRLYNYNIEETQIPILPIEIQKAIVEILDKFNEMTTSIESGIPAEIDKVHKQYEYYRDKLLTFEALNED